MKKKGERTQYIVGRKDGVKRRVSHIPVDMETPKSRVPGSPHYVTVFLELSPDHIVQQVVNDSRIQTGTL